MKKLLTVIFAACLTVCLTAMPAFATTTSYNGIIVPDKSDLSTTYVLDHYGLLSQSDLQSYESQAAQLSDSTGCNVYLLIVDNIGGHTQRSFAEAYFKANNLGRGANADGVLFMIAVSSRDYVTITHGQGSSGGIHIFTDYYIEKMEDDIVSYLKDNRWSAACQAYLNDVNYTFDFYQQNGEPLDYNNAPKSWQDTMMYLAIAILLGLVISAFICFSWYKQMKTARQKTEANDYLDYSTFKLTVKNDRYITTTVTRVKVESDGPRGGSSISSSGFGGSSGGKF